MAMDRDYKLIRAILRRGSKAAAEELVRAYYDEIYAYVYRQTGNRDDALDLTQESFIAALQCLASYDTKKARFRTWLYHIASHKVIDARRRLRPTTQLPEDVEIADDYDLAAITNDRLLLQNVEEYVRGADPLDQEVFRLHLYADCSFSEIAAAMGEAEEKLKARYYRLLRKIRKEFASDER